MFWEMSKIENEILCLKDAITKRERIDTLSMYIIKYLYDKFNALQYLSEESFV